ncbi:MAG: tRNA guanosine(34) transglycosylase Tgt [Candidatus Omnitrophica bacterium CG11_big_fil_rev_8_21_14_0_20_45_26]|uniref:Queuine tRNA-ribosyltransferase n=1 Tax=Candidatus Abzuiibacterium crystallinum TaxID=1974748 RepID=A0A2H0LSL1_9BACT|nr:MAG: tRNA guanosine(34) transglycosylase Tgt [Candidatus Omnitrophica bacterium CG11_big_fil_rev_8_21_14_0_20_45_26]PIW64766.1 MAG: tRNA guanosine(34) transglycosylase Tgt [Candidatus Omnitrophica bacterium CG12_big_fil_rev_8_21_14_0_65_45_16]
MSTVSACFEKIQNDTESHARLGRVRTARGSFETPGFLPVGTQGSVKSISPRELIEAGTQAILCNTYHLYVRPGLEVIERAGSLHRFIGWDKPILTDSGGYQVFSLTKMRKLTREGVEFNSHFDGRKIFLSPEIVMHIQSVLQSDIAMVFDECPPAESDKAYLKNSLDLTVEWARRSKQAHQNMSRDGVTPSLLFGIIQGGRFLDLRQESLERTVEIGFDGYAVGGVSVGEPHEQIEEVVREMGNRLPEHQVRYLMGVGTPKDLFMGVEAGFDFFDCVNPTRYGRNGSAFTSTGRLVIRNAKYTFDQKPIDETCGCYACRHFSRSYIRHLINCEEILGARLLSLHNVHFFLNLMRRMREAIQTGTFAALKKEFESHYEDDLR